MEKTLILANTGIGNHISSTLVLAKALSRTSEVHGLFNRHEGYLLMRHTPYFKSCNLSRNMECKTGESLTDLAKSFSLYDSVYIPLKSLYYRIRELVDPSLLTNVVHRTEFPETYFPKHVLDVFGLQDADISIDIEWYKEYYSHNGCKSNTILINGTADNPIRTYKRINEVGDILSVAFDIKTMDFSKDIRKNLHLINQAKYILTTDTSTLWLARALGKSPFVFYCKNNYKSGKPEEVLGVKNIIDNPDSLNKIEPVTIAKAFMKLVEAPPMF